MIRMIILLNQYGNEKRIRQKNQLMIKQDLVVGKFIKLSGTSKICCLKFNSTSAINVAKWSILFENTCYFRDAQWEIPG